MKNFPLGEGRFSWRFVVKEVKHGNVKPLARYVAGTIAFAEPIRVLLAPFGPVDDAPTLDEIMGADSLSEAFHLLMERAAADAKLVSFMGLPGDAVMNFAEGGQQFDWWLGNQLQPPVIDTTRDTGSTAASAWEDLDVDGFVDDLFNDPDAIERDLNEMLDVLGEKGAELSRKQISFHRQTTRA